jgi:sterol 24-C-methyltransferase
MEDHLFKSLDLSARATILDAGCRVGYIAIRIATKGLRVFGINVVNYYLVKANKNIKAANLK